MRPSMDEDTKPKSKIQNLRKQRKNQMKTKRGLQTEQIPEWTSLKESIRSTEEGDSETSSEVN